MSFLALFAAGPALAANYLEAECGSTFEATPPSPSEDPDAHLAASHGPDSQRDTRALSALQVDAPFSLQSAANSADEIPLILPDDGPSALAESSFDTNTDLMPNLQIERDESEGPDASIPGVSDDQLQRFKRQMFRKDI
ncbi:MAG: hypothetical protein KJN77_00120 [Gammaproteobacteria bacterium]|nr:hypothetical protein [Gammaproteobacteria bacterium]